jgi:hypothetical protein
VGQAFIALKTADEWVYPTLLGAAFHSGDLEKARHLVEQVSREPTPWKLASTLADLTDAVELQPDAQVRSELVDDASIAYEAAGACGTRIPTP